MPLRHTCEKGLKIQGVQLLRVPFRTEPEPTPWSDDETRAKKRARIAEDAGDTLSLLGTTSDGAHLLLIHMARLATAPKVAQNIAAVRAAATPFANLMEAYLTKIDADPATAKLPYTVKPGGEAAALHEIETRATAVADALSAEE